jgi:TorA maturation chaperone TorD
VDRDKEVKVEIQEFISREKARGDCCKLLSACFYQPRKEMFLSEDLFGNLIVAMNQVSAGVAALAETMGKAFLKYSEEDLTVSYAKLFLGPNELVAPPYGSVYLDKERRLMGDSTMKVIETYREAGLSMDDEFREVPDHITAELEFMYYLIFKEVEALEISDKNTALYFMGMQESFFTRFLGRWIPPFSEKIKEGTDNEFYRGLAACLSAFAVHLQPGDDIPDSLKTKALNC